MDKNYLWMKTIALLILLIAGTYTLKAQERFNGIVLEYKSNEVMPQVAVKNLNKGDSVLTNKAGAFSITANKEDILVFSSPGYRTDSLVVIDFALKRVYLTSVEDPRMLETVNVSAMTDTRIAEEMARLRNEGQYANTVSGGGIGLSPSRIFGRGARDARRQYKLLEEESNSRLIDAKFNESLVASLTPLKGDDLSLFMVKYRPKASFIRESNDETLRVYIMDSYNKYKVLSPSAKEKIRLHGKENGG